MTAELLFVGDLHGDLKRARMVAEFAKKNDIKQIVQVGDWGFIWPGRITVQQLSDILKGSGVRMRFVDGNHDVHPFLRVLDAVEDNVAPQVTYQRRGSVWTSPRGLRLGFLGGAPSIDWRDRRLGISWWTEEEITDEDVDVMCQQVAVDILVTHDAPLMPPMTSKADTSDVVFRTRADASQRRVRHVVRHFRPRLLVHGHYHMRYSFKLGETRIEGLASNMEPFRDSVLTV